MPVKRSIQNYLRTEMDKFRLENGCQQQSSSSINTFLPSPKPLNSVTQSLPLFFNKFSVSFWADEMRWVEYRCTP